MKKKLLTMIGSVCLILVLAALLLPACAAPAPTTPAPSPAAPAEVIHWKMQISTSKIEAVGPYKYPLGMIYSYGWADWLREATDGRLEVEVIMPEVAFPGAEGLTAIGSGIVEAAWSASGWWVEQWLEWYVYIGLPGSWSSTDEILDAFFNYGLNEMVMEQGRERNLVVFPTLMMEHFNVQSCFPMPDASSLKGKKIRGLGVWAPYLEMLDANPVKMAYGDLYMGMKLGTIDGLITGVQGMEAMKLKEVITHFVTNRFPENNVVLVNLNAFNALPEDIQRIILTGTPYYLAVSGASWCQVEEYYLAKAVEEYGITLWTWSNEDMAKITEGCLEEVWPALAEKSPGVAELVELVTKQLREHGKI